jgi:putative resolvase
LLFHTFTTFSEAENDTEQKEIDSKPKKEKYIYCRVSSSNQKEDLQRQIDYLKERYPDHQIVKDIASGINFKRKGLNKIMARAIEGAVEEVVVAHRDRLCRIAFEHFEWLFEQYGVNLIVEDKQEHSSEKELSEDLFSLIHVFSARHYGLRRKYTTRKSPEEPVKETKKTGNVATQKVSGKGPKSNKKDNK